MADLKVTTVPFRTTGEIITSLLSGQVQLSFETVPGVIGQVRGGTLRALAVSSEKPTPQLPGVPTIAESGTPSYVLESWSGYVVPAATPPDIVAKLNDAIVKAVNSPEVSQKFIELGITPRASTPDQMRATYEADVVRWRKVITEAKIEQR